MTRNDDKAIYGELTRQENRFREGVEGRHSRAKPYKREKRKVDPNDYTDDDFPDDDQQD